MRALSLLSVALCLVASLSRTHGYVRYSLDGSDWMVHNVNGSISVPATVPGQVHLDLLRAGLISEPYYRYNEAAYKWIPYEPYWTFTKLFTPNASLTQHSTIELAFDGLDTVADLLLNNHHVASSQNMFRRLVVTLGPHALMAGQNNLTVRIHSPVLSAQQYFEGYPYELPVSDPASELPYRNFLRKAQSDSGWDWGGGFGPSGIWKHVELRAYDEAILVDATVIAKQMGDSGNWRVNVTAYLRVAPQARSGPLMGAITTTVGNVTSKQAVHLPPSHPNDGDDLSVVSVISTVCNPALWWPVGYRIWRPGKV